MKFGKYLLQHSVPEWKKKYLNYKLLKERIKKCKDYTDQTVAFYENQEDPIFEPPAIIDTIENEDWSPLLSGGSLEDFNFVKCYQHELSIVINFYKERIQDVSDRYQQLQTQCRILEGESLLQENSESDQEVELQFVSKSSNPRKQLTEAILEFYRMLQLLENYRILNEIAARKILKKYHKARGLDIIPLQSKTRKVLETDADVPKRLLSLTEEMYMHLFEDDEGKRMAKKQLRIPQDQKMEQLVIWRAGFMTGLSIPTLVAIVYTFSTKDHSSIEQFMLQVYGGFSIPIFFIYLFAWCLIILQQAHVNWILIFELDPRSYMSPIEFEHFASGLLLFFSINVFLALNNAILGIDPQIYIITQLIVFLSILFCPFKTFYYQGRMWVLETLWRVISSGFHPVQFRDFFLSDLLSSMTYSFIAIQSAFCISFTYPNGVYVCTLYNNWLPSLVTSLPAWIRFVQCLRRYHDNKNIHPHLTNAVKYILSLVAIIFSIASRFGDSIALTSLWMIFSGCASVYAYCWDVMFDWGLFAKNSSHKYLRDEITYPPWFYYFAIVYFKLSRLNGLLRFTWIILLAPNYWNSFTIAPVIVYCLALLELLRRIVWVLIRMENEHANNVGNYRVTKDLPLPFHVPR